MPKLDRIAVTRSAAGLLGRLAGRLERAAQAPSVARARAGVRDALAVRRRVGAPLGVRAAPPPPWPVDRLESLRRCPVCTSPSRVPLYVSLRGRGPGEWNLHRCSRCEVAYLDPRPPPVPAPAIGGSSRRPAPSAIDRLVRAVRNGYLNRARGLALRPAEPLGWWWYRLRPRSRARLEAAAGPVSGRHRPGHLLQIGHGGSEAVRVARGAGWRVTVLRADGLTDDGPADAGVVHRRGTPASATLPDRAFDAINIAGGLEGMRRPVAELRACARALRPGGVLQITAANLDSLGHRHYRRGWAPLDPPASLVIYTRTALARLLAEAGFGASRIVMLPLGARPTFRQSEPALSGGGRGIGAWLRRAAVDLKAATAETLALLRPAWSETLVAGAIPATGAARAALTA